MAGVRFAELQSRPMAFLDFTSVTLDELQQLVPPFEAACHARMAAWRMDGKPRTARRFTVDKNGPLPTPEDRLLFILVYLKTYALQVVQGRLFGMVQGKPTSGLMSSSWRCWWRCAPSAMPPHAPDRVPVGCGYILQAHLSAVTGAKRPGRESSHGFPVVL